MLLVNIKSCFETGGLAWHNNLGMLSTRTLLSILIVKWRITVCLSFLCEVPVCISASRVSVSHLNEYISFALPCFLITLWVAFVLENEARVNFLFRLRLRDNEKQWRDILETCPDGVIVQTRQGVKYANKSACNFGDTHGNSTSSESESARVKGSVSGKTAKRFGQWTEQVLKQLGVESTQLLDDILESIPPTEVYLRHTDESRPQFIEVTGTRTTWCGEPAALFVMRDVSERKQRDNLRLAEKTKSILIATVSHEFRTPLNGILGMLQLLADFDMTAEARKFLKIAFTSGKLLLNLINDMLDMSKIEAGKFELTIQRFNIRFSIEEITEIFSFQAAEKKVSLELQMDDDVPEVAYGDIRRVQQILLNLVSNALKFTKKGGIVIRVKLDSSDSTHCIVRFEVQDTGPGIKEADVGTLFSVFGMIQDTKSDNPSGSGLGLNICKQLCQYMGGDISVKSVYGLGSTFAFTIRLALSGTAALPRNDSMSWAFSSDAGSSPEARKTPRVSSSSTLSLPSDFAPLQRSVSNGSPSCMADLRSCGKTTILLVEDNDFNAMVATTMLNKDRFTVLLAKDGVESVDLYKEHRDRILMVLMDCNMPRMNGFQATGLIRAYEKELHVPPIAIVGLTAAADQASIDHCLSSGMDFVLSKPISRGLLLEQVESVLAGRKLTQQAPAFAVRRGSDASDIVSDTLTLPIPSVSLPLSSPLSPISATPLSVSSCSRADTSSVSSPLSSQVNAVSESELDDHLRPSVLCVEDNTFNVLVVSSVLEREGYSVLVGHDGLEAVRLYTARASELSVVLMDINLPRLNGYQAAEGIRVFEKEAGLPRVPIIGLTESVGPEATEKALASGIDCLVCKPVELDSLVVTIAKLKKKASSAAPGATCLSDNTLPSTSVGQSKGTYDSFAQPMNPTAQLSASCHSPARKILLVEDNQFNAMVATTMLQKDGYSVELAVDGVEAVEKYQDNPHGFSLILMDFNMPRMNGLQATTAIRDMERAHQWRRLPIIGLTAAAEQEYIDQCMAGGMDAILNKPISRIQLLEFVVQYSGSPPQGSPL
eukprot:GILJ01012886.1.p1 GENE.GILJ01012886.1~~GILJ01012886.1.p1  ORF type:complete len:1054 (+),score=128.72 GILJ01012886.1:340-3501(+)